MSGKQRSLLKRLLTRTVHLTVKGKAAQAVVLEPSERLVLFVEFMIAALFCLVALQISVLFVLHIWSSEVFAAITGIIGTVTGILIYHNA